MFDVWHTIYQGSDTLSFLSIWINVEHLVLSHLCVPGNTHKHQYLNYSIGLYVCNCRYAYKTKNRMSYIIQKYSHSRTLLGHQADHDSEHRPHSVLWFRQGREKHPSPNNNNTGYTVVGVLGLGWLVYKVTV